MILQANNADYDAVRAFYHSVIDAQDPDAPYIGWKKDIYPAPEFLRESIGRGELYIRLDHGSIAAAMVLNRLCNEGYARFPWPVELAPDEIFVIHALGVHPGLLRRGHAKAMVQKALGLAGAAGAGAIRLDVLEGNTPAEKLYEGLGFQRRGELKLYYEDTGWKTFRLYERLLTGREEQRLNSVVSFDDLCYSCCSISMRGPRADGQAPMAKRRGRSAEGRGPSAEGQALQLITFQGE